MRLSSVLVAAAAPAALGCAGTVAAPSEAEAARTTTAAVVIVERAASDVDGARAAEASARFLRVSAGDVEDALRSIGATVELPELGSCARRGALAAAASAEAPPLQKGARAAPVVELIDVGSVSIETEGVATSLAARLLPDVTDVVSGVVYARAAADPAFLPPGARYAVHVGGGRDLGPFDFVAQSPGEPADAVVVATASSIDLGWPPHVPVRSGSAPGNSDVVYVDVGAVRCAFGDVGFASIPRALVADAPQTMVVHRLHREPIRARGIDAGEVRFDFARTMALSP